MRSVPTEADWVGFESDLDATYAHKIFFGKSNAEMQNSFRYNVIERTDEIRFMPRMAFQYYVFGLRDHALSKNFDYLGGSDAASCFLGLVKDMLKNKKSHILPVIQELLPAVEYVANNQEEFEAEEEIYGSFMEAFKEIQALVGHVT